MPFTLLSHQAAALPLKLLRPRWFCGTALVFGSMAPDFEYFWRGVPVSTIGHTPLGQWTWCLPWTLLLAWLFRRVIALPLAAHLPGLGPFRLRDYGLLATAADGPGCWLRAVPSAVIGSWSHVLFDSATHEHGCIVEHAPLLQGPVSALGRKAPVYIVLNWAGTIVGAAVTVAVLYVVGSRRLLAEWEQPQRDDSPFRATSRTAWCLWLLTAAGLVLGVGVGFWMPAGRFPLWLKVFLHGTLGAYVGLLAGCAAAVSCRPSRGWWRW